MNKIFPIYNKLLKTYGPQQWWPVTPTGKLEPIHSGGPKTKKQQLEVMFGAILTQNTSWKNVEKAIVELNKRDLINIDKVLELHTNEVASIIKSSGYYNQKAKKLKNVCLFLKKYPVEKLQKLEIKDLRKLLLSVNGIGNETADAIILYAFNKPIFVVDAYTHRVFSRIGLIKKKATYHEIQELFQNSLKPNTKLFNEYHALIVVHGKRICKKEPICNKCVIKLYCKKYLKENARGNSSG